jgi:hypothetical protein
VLALGVRCGAPWWTLASPLAIAAIAAWVPGLPTLSHRPRLSIAWLATAAPLAAIAIACAVSIARLRPRPRPARRIVRADRSALAITAALVAPPLGVAIACAMLCGLPAALVGGAPPRVPGWTGELLFWSAQVAAGLVAAGVMVVAGGAALSARRPPPQAPADNPEPAAPGSRTSGSPDRTSGIPDSRRRSDPCPLPGQSPLSGEVQMPPGSH